MIDEFYMRVIIQELIIVKTLTSHCISNHHQIKFLNKRSMKRKGNNIYVTLFIQQFIYFNICSNEVSIMI